MNQTVVGFSHMLDLPYTICFCISGDKVLLQKRIKQPNQGLWNGVGGKIEEGETPVESIKREVQEETDLDVSEASMSYVGIVTWQKPDRVSGMHCYIAEFPRDFELPFTTKDTREGLLEWKQKAWVFNKNNNEVVENIPLFLPSMLNGECTWHVFLYDEQDSIASYERKQLPDFYIARNLLIK